MKSQLQYLLAISPLSVMISPPIKNEACCCCCSVAKLCPTPFNPVDCSMPGFSVLHYLLELAQIPVHWVSDVIQPAHPLLPPFHFVFSLSQHQSLFQWVTSSNQVAKLLELRQQSFQWIFRVDFLQDRLVWFPCSPKDSQEFTPAPQFESITSTLQLFLRYWHITADKTIALTIWTFVNRVMSLLFKTPSKFVTAFFPEHGCSHHLQWFWRPKNKICH